jgi:hypothetical protein
MSSASVPLQCGRVIIGKDQVVNARLNARAKLSGGLSYISRNIESILRSVSSANSTSAALSSTSTTRNLVLVLPDPLATGPERELRVADSFSSVKTSIRPNLGSLSSQTYRAVRDNGGQLHYDLLIT